MEDFTFDLQIFAEGEGMESAPAVEASEAAPEPAAQEPVQEAAPEFALRKNPDTGRMEFLEGHEIQPKQEEPQQQAQPNAAYTADELVKDFAMGRVDEARIPQDLAGYYAAIKTQQENAQLRQQAAMQQQMAMQQPQVQEQAPQADNGAKMVAVYQQMEKYARDKAFRELGINGEEGLSELQYSDNPEDKQKAAVFGTAVQQNMQMLSRAVADEQARMAAEAQATANEVGIIKNGVAEYMKSEPNFGEIDKLMATHWQEMPFAKSGPIVQTLNRVAAAFKGVPGAKLLPQDKDVLNEYYQECKKAYYAKQTGVGTTPQPVSKPQVPNVEHPGQASNTPPNKVDWTAMRSMSPRERRNFFMNNI